MNPDLDLFTMHTGDVGRMLGVGSDRVRQLDDELQPIRLPGTNRRRYSVKRVQQYAAQRAKKVG